MALDAGDVEQRVRAALAGERDLAGAADPLAHWRRSLSLPTSEVLAGDRGDLDAEVDAVEEGAGQAGQVAVDLVGRAVAAAGGRTVETAGAGVHRGDELEAGREFGTPRRARNADPAGLQRFAQRFEHAAIELGQLVEEEHSVVGERDLVISIDKCKNHENF